LIQLNRFCRAYAEDVDFSCTTAEDDLTNAESVLTALNGKFLILFKNPAKVEWHVLEEDHALVKAYQT